MRKAVTNCQKYRLIQFDSSRKKNREYSGLWMLLVNKATPRIRARKRLSCQCRSHYSSCQGVSCLLLNNIFFVCYYFISVLIPLKRSSLEKKKKSIKTGVGCSSKYTPVDTSYCKYSDWDPLINRWAESSGASKSSINILRKSHIFYFIYYYR